MSEMLCKSQIKEKYGVTDGLIKKFFPEPIKRRNPKYHAASMMQLWDAETVESVMNQPDFQAAFKKILEKRPQRKEAAQRITDAKIEKTRTYVEYAIDWLNITVWEADKVIDAALESKFKREEEHGRDGWYVFEADSATQARWAVNFIRHKLMDYNDVMGLLKRRDGGRDLYIAFNEAVYKKIAEAYPVFAEECNRQYEQKLFDIAHG